MAAINHRRVAVGAIAGGAVFFVWSILINFLVLGQRYEAAQAAGHFLKEPRYSTFLWFWILTILVLSSICAWFYAHIRNVREPGPRTALLVGIFIGFAAGFPLSFSTASWSPIPRIFPFWWMMELWVGCVLASIVGGWLYKD